jgi:plasmid stability protein
MAQLLVRKLDDDLVVRLKARAAEHGRSAEAEHRAILQQALRPKDDDFWARADEFRRRTAGKMKTDSTDLIREERDRRAGLIE